MVRVGCLTYLMVATQARKTGEILNDRSVKECYRVVRTICGPLRYKIICLLSANARGLTVTELAETLGSSLSRVSHQLRILRVGKLVRAERQNRQVIYTLKADRLHRHLALKCL